MLHALHFKLMISIKYLLSYHIKSVRREVECTVLITVMLPELLNSHFLYNPCFQYI